MAIPTKNPVVEDLAFSIASFIVGAGIIGLVFYLTVVPLMDLFSFFLMWLLPVCAIFVALGLVSAGTFNAAKAFATSGVMKERIVKWTNKLRENPEAQPA